MIEWYDETICGPGNMFELYNLKNDIGERNNLAKKMPEKTEDLSRMLAIWRRKVNAQMMASNPDYNPKKANKSNKHKS